MPNVEISPYMIDTVFKIGIIMISTLGVVYLFGRLLHICVTDKTKNRLAAVILLLGSLMVWYLEFPTQVPHLFEYDMVNQTKLISRLIFLYTSSVVAYILIGWRLYWRVDGWLDRKVAHDNHFEPVTKKEKSNGK